MKTEEFNATAALAEAITAEIKKYKEQGLENAGGFSVDAEFDPDDQTFDARCSFENDYTMTVYLNEGSDVERVEKFWNEDESEIVDAADLLLGEGWVKGYHTYECNVDQEAVSSLEDDEDAA